MASLRYHAGRMVLYEAPLGWRVRIKAKKGKLDLPLESTSLEGAVSEAEQLYADARAIDDSHPYCQQCIHWKAVAAKCDLGFPEGGHQVDDLQETAVPTGAIDCGDGFYIEIGEEPGIGEVRYAACMPGGAICRYANDLWQAQIYIEHLKGNRFQ